MRIEQYICDRMLGKLCKHLRLLGFDAPLVDDPPLHLKTGQILLTRRRKLLDKQSVLFIRHDRIDDQLKQVFAELELSLQPNLLFSRCIACNKTVEPVAREEIWGQVPDFTYHNAPGFTRCPQCGKIYWPGSHVERARIRFSAILGGNG